VIQKTRTTDGHIYTDTATRGMTGEHFLKVMGFESL